MSNFISIASADRIYEVASDASVGWLIAEHSDLADLSVSVRNISRSLGDLRMDPYWSEVLSALRLMRWCLSSIPLRFSHPSLGVGEILRRIESRVPDAVAAYPRHVEHLNETVALAQRLVASNDDPLGDIARGALSEVMGQRSALLLPSRRHQQAVEAAFSGLAPWLEVVTAGDLADCDPYGLLVATGTTYVYRREPFVFLAPRAEVVQFVRWKWVHDEFPSRGVLEGGRSSSRAARFASSPMVRGLIEADEVAPVLDWNAIGNRVGLHRDSQHAPESLEAWMFILAGGNAVPLAVGGQSLTIEPDAEGSDRLRTDVPVDDLEPDDYILVREAGSGDFLIDVADRLMGSEGRSLRARQREWKSILRQRIAEVGLDAVSAALRALGARHAHPWNVRYWAGTRALKPDDFALLMKYLGLDAAADGFAAAMDQLIRFHIKAGHRIRKMILDGIGEADLAPLAIDGIMSFELEGADGGTLTAYRIESRSEQTWQAPVGRLGRVVEVGQLWPG